MSGKIAVMLLLPLVAGCGLPRVPAHPYTAAEWPDVPLQVCWLETGGTTASGGFGAAGWTRASTWEVTTSAILIRHRDGDILIDSGMTPDPQGEASELHGWARFLFEHTAGSNQPRGDLRELLKQAGVTHLKGVILSHAHSDHAGGLLRLPEVPVWLAPEEASFVRESLRGEDGVVLPREARSLLPRMVEIPFAERPYANSDRSWDVFGDGAVVVVPTYGHTPGSVSTFVNLGGRRLIHVGDLINLQESIDRGVPKSAAMRQFTDEDTEETDRQVARLVQLHEQDPALWILPAHDRPAWEAFFGKLPLTGAGPRCVGPTP